MSENLRLLIALGLALAWILWVYRIFKQENKTKASFSDEQQTVVLYASQSGQSFSLAKKLASSLENAPLLPLNKVTSQSLQLVQKVYLFVSTYGDGESPDNGRGFIHQLKKLNKTALQHLEFELTALGDSRYPEFCAFGYEVFNQLVDCGAKPVNSIQCLDANMPQSHERIQSSGNTSRITLEKRTHLNPASQSEGLFLLEFKTENCQWEAGDIVDIYVPDPDNQERYLHPRSYSIASAYEGKKLKLIVRLQKRSDGTLGHASGYLTQLMVPGNALPVNIVENPMCKITDSQVPLLLIGAGSGLAGLVGQIETRAYTKQKIGNIGPIWLIYGERDPELDLPLHEKLLNWQQEGVLTIVDRAFSRNPAKSQYVQDILLEKASSIEEFLGNNGHIYLCGSKDKMGDSVDKAISRILGEAGKEKMIQSTRYHRDLY
ncbi:NADPH cytochrome P450 oxidoreductase family protein [Glaciecola sp. 1036]|uniref:NADPH cytochrome P450 oxidoreductase family protein n=1 Tax=Alteromonadaceae TaxID=72275 RepID=UPI003CFDD015